MILRGVYKVTETENLLLLKLQKGMERLVNKYAPVATEYHLTKMSELLALIEKACNEGNAFIVQPEYCGYFVVIWQDAL